MNKSGLLLSMLASALACGLVSACSTEPVPDMPSFETDIKPFTVARCVRCHGGGGTLNLDPDTTDSRFQFAPTNGFFDQYGDPPGCMTPNGLVCRGLAYYSAATPVDGGSSAGQGHALWNIFFPEMPPAPAAKLSDRERELIEKWIANPLP